MVLLLRLFDNSKAHDNVFDDWIEVGYIAVFLGIFCLHENDVWNELIQYVQSGAVTRRDFNICRQPFETFKYAFRIRPKRK